MYEFSMTHVFSWHILSWHHSFFMTPCMCFSWHTCSFMTHFFMTPFVFHDTHFPWHGVRCLSWHILFISVRSWPLFQFIATIPPDNMCCFRGQSYRQSWAIGTRAIGLAVCVKTIRQTVPDLWSTFISIQALGHIVGPNNRNTYFLSRQLLCRLV